MAQGFMETGNSDDFSPEWYSPVPSRAPHAQTKTLETRRVNSNVKKKTVSKKILESFATSAEQSKNQIPFFQTACSSFYVVHKSLWFKLALVF
jgi:hypothetical protein